MMYQYAEIRYEYSDTQKSSKFLTARLSKLNEIANVVFNVFNVSSSGSQHINVKHIPWHFMVDNNEAATNLGSMCIRYRSDAKVPVDIYSMSIREYLLSGILFGLLITAVRYSTRQIVCGFNLLNRRNQHSRQFIRHEAWRQTDLEWINKCIGLASRERTLSRCW